MILYAFVVPIVLVLLTLFRFRRRFNAEFDRQTMITWPVSSAIFTSRPIELEKKGQPGAPTVSKLEQSYSFYTQGEAFTGNRLIPEITLIAPEEEDRIERKLNEQGRTWWVKYNPDDPSENMLKAGHGGLSWSKVLVYAFFGVILPGFFIYAAMAYLTDPVAWWDAVTFGEMKGVQNN